MLFVRNPDLLKRLVAVLLGIPLASITDFQTINTEMPPEEIGTKFCRLDINMIVDGRQVNLEVQIEDEGIAEKDTALAEQAKLIAELQAQLKK